MCRPFRSWTTFFLLVAVTTAARGDASLRGGNMAAPHGSGTPGAVSSQTTTAATVATAQAALVAANAQAASKKSLQALQALQAAQGVARQTALAGGVNNLGFDPNHNGQTLPNVPDGIAVGGLMPAGGATLVANSATSYNVPLSWTNVSALSQSNAGGKVTDTVTQSGQQALLYWNSFNVGRNTTLSFDQSAGGANVNQWVAINEIQDPSLSPSQILGSIQAPGQVYVINQNGIIFGGSSQVNVHGLVASSLALNPAYVANGLLNNAQNSYQFQFSALEAATTSGGTTTVAPLWTAAASGTSQLVFAAPTGDITVQAGAQLTSSTNPNHDGGRIALIAPNVVNNGTISTPDGQMILAAGEQVALTAHASNDPTLRGLDVSIGQVAATAATLQNETFTFNGFTGNSPLADNSNLPGSESLTIAGSGQVGSYTTADGTTTPLVAGTTAVPLGSAVQLSGGTVHFDAAQEGAATNNGDIEAPRADVTIAGKSVSQNGVINSSTSATLNGRVDLLANYDAPPGTISSITLMYPFATGSVIFGADSVTQVLPELSDASDVVVGTQLALPSLVNVEAQTIEMLPGSLLYAPSASTPTASAAVDAVQAKITSGVNFDAGTWFAIGSTGAQTSIFSYNQGTITLDSGATIDVSGSENVADSVSQNIVAAQLRGPELANSTLQQNGALRGTTVIINLQDMGVYNGVPWIGTPLGDVSGYVDDVEHTVGQLTTGGGTIALNAGTSVNLASGSTINVSGGWINYAGAFVQTSKVVTQNGQLIDISQALPDMVYEGIYNGYTEASPKYGIYQNFQSSLLTGGHYETGYLQGGSGGALVITAPSMMLKATFEGNTVTGPSQQTPVAQLASTYSGAAFLPVAEQVAGIPNPSSLDLSFFQLTNDNVGNVYASSSPSIFFETDAFLAQNTAATNQIFLSQDIINTRGFGDVAIDTSSSGNITVGPGVTLAAPYGGDLNFLAANITIDGTISVPGQGSLTLRAPDVSPFQTGQVTTIDPTRGNIVLTFGGALLAQGVVADAASGGGGLPLALNGGSISLAALNLDLEVGSTIDVSGGAALLQNKTVEYGNGGSIAILAGKDPVNGSLVGGQLELASTLRGYSGVVGGAGSLTIQTSLVQIGGSTLQNGDTSSAVFTPGSPGLLGNGTTLWVNSAGQPDFFSQGGFGSFTIEGVGAFARDGQGNIEFDSAGDPVIDPAVLFTAGTRISPLVQGSIASLDHGEVVLTPLTVAATAELLPSQRSAVNLVFNAEGFVNSGLGTGPPLPNGGIFQNPTGGGGLVIRGDLVMEDGTLIETGPQSNSSHGVQLLAGHGTAAIEGSVYAPGGTIVVQGGNTSSYSSNDLLFYGSSPNQPFPTVDLGPNSVLSTAGTGEQTFNPLGYNTGVVLSGGNVALSGNIVAEAGSVIDVAGAAAVFDEQALARNVSRGSLLTTLYAPMEVASNGGSISLSASQLLLSDATLLGNAGGPSALGGSLSVSSGFTATIDPTSGTPSPSQVTLVVTQQGRYGGFSLPSNYGTGLAVVEDTTAALPIVTATGNGDSIFVANPNLFVTTAAASASSDNGGQAGGFAQLKLGGTVDFEGPVTIQVSQGLSVGLSSGNASAGETGGVIYADSSVTLSAPYVALNLNQASTAIDALSESGYPSATGGSGTLTIDASVLVDVGDISLQGIGTLNFNPAGTVGAVRGEGTLQVGGTVNLNATQVYPATADTFTIDATTINVTANTGEGLPQLPISGGGTIDLNATTIVQSGVLRAPLGTINLGDGSTQSVTLAAGSITSVSAVDPLTGQGIFIPYGIIDSSGDWIDPKGNDITAAGNGPGGVPSKSINVTSQNIDTQPGSTLDISGGGDLFAYGFVPGTGGNLDILGSTGTGQNSTSFAVVPGYSAGYAPVGTYSGGGSLTTDGATDVGYFNSGLAVGESVYLDGTTGLPAGLYTLLPARYALLPGAFLISPSTARPSATSVVEADGSSVVAGYITSGLNPASAGLYSAFSVVPQPVVLARAPYSLSTANAYFPGSAATAGIAVPRLPQDAGQLVFNAGSSMILGGTLLSQAAAGGLGGEVDIASSSDIYIVGAAQESGVPSGALALDAGQLTGFGAASLLIGGERTHTEIGTQVTVTTDNLVVDNAGSPLGAPDLILVSGRDLTLDAGAQLLQTGAAGAISEPLYLGGTSGNAPLGSGDGTLIRVSSDPNSQIARANVNSADTAPALVIGAQASIQNADGGPVGTLILDSTAGLSVNTAANLAPTLSGNTLTLDSGSINIELSAPATAPTSGLIITNDELQSLLASTQSLSFLSYSSLALFGSGEIGALSNGTYQESSLALHADDIYYGDTQGSSGITINAQTVTIDNHAGGSALPTLTNLGTSALTIHAQTVQLGSGSVRLDQFNSTTINASSAIIVRGLGTQVANSDNAATPSSLTAGGNLVLVAPIITNGAPDIATSATTTTAVDESIIATGNLTIGASSAPSINSAAPGATLAFVGSSIDQTGGVISAPSGSVSLTATSGNLDVDGSLAAGGVAHDFYGLTKYTNGGTVSLSSPSGNITLGADSSVNVSAASGVGTVDSMAGNAGSLIISAPTGTFTVDSVAGSLNGSAGQVISGTGLILSQGAGGSFSLDAAQLTGTNLSGLESEIVTANAVEPNLVGGFNYSQTIRLRNQSITIDGVAASQNFDLSVDNGSITVGPAGRIIATTAQAGGIDTTLATQNGATILSNPGSIGGSIALAATGSVSLQAGSVLSVAGQDVDDAGEGGAISLDAGSETVTGGTVAINPAGFVSIASGAVLDLRTLQTTTSLDGSVINGTSGTLNIRAPQILSGGNPVGIQVNPVLGTIAGASTVTVEGYKVYQPTGGVIDSVTSSVLANGAAFSSAMGTGAGGLNPLFANTVFVGATPAVDVKPGAEIVNPAGNLVLQHSWDLSTARFGTNNLGQDLPGVLTVRASGDVDIDFGASLNDGFTGASYLATLLDPGSLSWSYNIVAGADFSAGELTAVRPLSALGGAGSLVLGYQASAPVVISTTSPTSNSLIRFFQTIRTGTGHIDISAGGNVELVNDLATIYTAGTQVDPTLGGLFSEPSGTAANGEELPATYSEGGGNVVIKAQGNIAHYAYQGFGSVTLMADSSHQMPTNWLDREGTVSGGQVITPTSWWVDFTNYFEGVGALGGGNVSLVAGGSVINVDADVPTNAREVNGQMVELGGGDLTVQAGVNIDGGAYYVERGAGTLTAGGSLVTNATRAAVTTQQVSTSMDWLPTTLFLGKGSFDVAVNGNLLLGPVATPFLLPQGANNLSPDGTDQVTFFSTYSGADSVDVSSLTGTATLQDYAATGQGSLANFYSNVLDAPQAHEISDYEPWLRLVVAENESVQAVIVDVSPGGSTSPGVPGNAFEGVTALLPPTLRVTAYGGDIDLVGSLTLAPSATGTLDLAARGSINGFEVNAVNQTSQTTTFISAESLIDVSDANPALLPGALNPVAENDLAQTIDPLFEVTGATTGLTLQVEQQLHATIDSASLHAADSDPIFIVASQGSISGVTAFTPKQTRVIAGVDLTDVALYLQNNNPDDISVVEAGQDITAYDASSPLRLAAGNNVAGFQQSVQPLGAGVGAPNAGDIQVGGPGTLEVVAGRNLNLGNDSGKNPNDTISGDGLYTGLTSVGDERNPSLPFSGADLVTVAGVGSPTGDLTGLGVSALDFPAFIASFVENDSTYLGELAAVNVGADDGSVATTAEFESLPVPQQDAVALQAFYLVLRDAGRDHNDATSAAFGTYTAGENAIADLFPSLGNEGSITLTSREVKTTNGGNIEMLVPGGQVTVGIEVNGTPPLDQGILTVDGGNISILAQGDVNVGSSRIFTLHGGNEVIWSSQGDIDAGASSKTVVSAPPTRVVVDPTSGDVETDLGGLATGGGIGVLASTVGVPAGDVDLIAPNGIVDAGDAGIRATGNLNIAAVQVLNASNIQVGGKSSGVPTSSSVNLGAISAASSAAGSSQQAATNTTAQNRPNPAAAAQDLPSLITVEVIGYGGGDADAD